MAASPQFRRLAAEVTQGLALSPILHNYLYAAKYPAKFAVDFNNHGGHRSPDGWFHPSTHPLMDARKLYYYIAHPDKLINEPLEYMGALSTTMGTAVHGFVQMCLKDHGCLLEDEVFVSDPSTKSRGSMDGILDLPSLGVDHVGFEFKTSNLMKLNGVDDNDIAGFRKKWPVYYAQVQEYMRISGLRKFVVLFMGMGYPWTLKEFVIPYDLMAASEVANKYLAVLKAVDVGVPPDPCCSMGSATSKACFARSTCPMGSL